LSYHDLRRALAVLGCTEMQGYLFSVPKPAEEVRRILIAHPIEASRGRLSADP
jgi:predicted signal transduction protein with EAL and GGDEF domain